MTDRELAIQIRRGLIGLLNGLRKGRDIRAELLIALPLIIKGLERRYGIGDECLPVPHAETETLREFVSD